jgi:hypothetical protein
MTENEKEVTELLRAISAKLDELLREIEKLGTKTTTDSGAQMSIAPPGES